MRILVTNDDGIQAEGIQVLARHLERAGHEIVVVAPDRDYSGSGAALGDLQPDVALDVRRVEIAGLGVAACWALAGPPALTVVAARLGAFGPPPDLVVSGINAGLNTGRSILHSGTVGAALTAQNFGISGLAVSVDRAETWHWDTAAAIAVEVLPMVMSGPSRSVLNLNVPGCPRDQVNGIRWARLATFGAVRAAISTRTEEHLQFELGPSGYIPEPDTDQGSVESGWAALTTLVGIVEAWPPASGALPDHQTYDSEIRPGAPLEAVHEIPDASGSHWLRRPDTAPSS